VINFTTRQFAPLYPTVPHCTPLYKRSGGHQIWSLRGDEEKYPGQTDRIQSLYRLSYYSGSLTVVLHVLKRNEDTQDVRHAILKRIIVFDVFVKLYFFKIYDIPCGASDHSSCGGAGCPWWQYHETVLNKMTQTAEQRAILVKRFYQTASVIPFSVI
jgi:hypothetical protein